ncbi:ATP phosphoribosyltransferase regulatory subunit [Paenibacillus naphthalenovorans]|uniref:ATP phosphoribosyltransferase regulatory subunit n=1 Tax=Paenibacillus naphthalenovorans TaxID=162209 RepID=A0A0U2UMR8_9BACL|nr:ATP phosphoribosyltransferase regulatory subunit [Paenibacillus naphthalenovorans]ALS24396.1 regulatory subunit of ATP phosphoribosyltransferase [Paenibacillus naphthalenovorans]
MSKPKVFEKPTGVKDYLPEAAAALRGIEFKVLQCMERWGYREIITPTLEYYDTVGVASSTEDKKLFKLLDRNGTTLVMRSDMTAPIARVVSSLLREHPFPLRLSYHANVFRAIEAEAGRDAEFFQTGVELVGDDSSESDAEVIALAVACLQAASVKEFKIALGHVGFLNGLFQEMLEGRPDAQRALKDCLMSRDYVGYRETIKALGLPAEVQKKLEGVLRLRGGQEICRLAQQVTHDPVAERAIAHLCEIWDVLKAYHVSEHVLIDLTMIGDFSYYTGMTFEGYAADLGFPVCSGGRYDNLLSQFGRPAPATGFALKTNRILEVVGKSASSATARRVLVAYTAEHREAALKEALALRSREGLMVETKLLDHKDGLKDKQPLDDGAFRVQGTVYQDVFEFVK